MKRNCGTCRFFEAHAALAAALAALLTASAWGQAPAEQIVPLVLEGNGWMQTIEIGNAEGGGTAVGDIRFYRTDGAHGRRAVGDRDRRPRARGRVFFRLAAE